MTARGYPPSQVGNRSEEPSRDKWKRTMLQVDKLHQYYGGSHISVA
ncbi:hypothetical protein CSC43_6920 [Pseudomonas aeruginosa]|nr:hypothetical protein CSC43_6920 [Pseudomonas aeruginosa]